MSGDVSMRHYTSSLFEAQYQALNNKYFEEFLH